MSNELTVPFGKYKGKPISSLIADKAYLNWCQSTNLLEKYPDVFKHIYCINISNNNNEDTPTPEHNKLQNLFLEDTIKERLVQKIYEDRINSAYKPVLDFLDLEKIGYEWSSDRWNISNTVFESKFGWDVKFDWNNDIGMWTNKLDDNQLSKCKEFLDNPKCKFYYEFLEDNGKILVIHSIPRSEFDNISFLLELKPIVGDDYPCILRKIQKQVQSIDDDLTRQRITRNYCSEFSGYSGFQRVLLIEKFESKHTSLEQLKTIFSQHRIKVVILSEIIEDTNNIGNKSGAMFPLSEDNLENLTRQELIERIKALKNEITVLKENHKN